MGGLISAKFLVVLVIALVVLGPEKLPEATRTMGRWVAELRRITTGFTEEVRSAFDSSELAEPVQELRSATQTLRSATTGWRGAATGWVMGQAGASPGSGSPLPSETTVAAPTALGTWSARPEGELGVPPGDPSLN